MPEAPTGSNTGRPGRDDPADPARSGWDGVGGSCRTVGDDPGRFTVQTADERKAGVVSETYATLKTNRGDIVVHLFPNHAPKTVENFVGLAEGTRDYRVPETGKKSPEPFYDGLGFHRVI